MNAAVAAGQLQLLMTGVGFDPEMDANAMLNFDAQPRHNCDKRDAPSAQCTQPNPKERRISHMVSPLSLPHSECFRGRFAALKLEFVLAQPLADG